MLIETWLPWWWLSLHLRFTFRAASYCVSMVVETWASSMNLWSLISLSVQPHYVWQILYGGHHLYGNEYTPNSTLSTTSWNLISDNRKILIDDLTCNHTFPGRNWEATHYWHDMSHYMCHQHVQDRLVSVCVWRLLKADNSYMGLVSSQTFTPFCTMS